MLGSSLSYLRGPLTRAAYAERSPTPAIANQAHESGSQYSQDFARLIDRLRESISPKK